MLLRSAMSHSMHQAEPTASKSVRAKSLIQNPQQADSMRRYKKKQIK